MSSTNRKRKSQKGSVQIKSSNERLQLVFTFAGKRRYLSLGLPDTKLNRRAAEAKAKLIEADIAYERFDTTLAKYKPQSFQVEESALTPIPTPKNSLVKLWEQYTQYRSSQLSPSTIARDYRKVAKRIQAIPSNVEGAVEIRDWLLRKYSSETARRTLVQLNACLNWAVKSKLSEDNPFEGMANDINKTSRNSSKEPFSQEEKDNIIAAIENNSFFARPDGVPHSYYASLVKFMFMTGCRPEEAAALQWKHVTTNCNRIYFEDALPCDTGIRGETKTRQPRVFPCNNSLRNLLLSLRPEKFSPEESVFRGPRGGVLDYHNFLNRVWRPVVEALVKAGKVEKYLPQYHMRHTFITLSLEHGLDAKDVGHLVGNSPKTIYQHYAGKKRELTVPEF